MEKYLRHYAEPEAEVLARMLGELPGQTHWSNVVVIPACNEGRGCLRPAPPCTPGSNERSLLILVINETESAPREVSIRNKALAASVQGQFECQWQSAPEHLGFGLLLFQDLHTSRDVLLVDRFSDGCKLPAKGGVGLARKIGADLATTLISHKRIRSPWMHCTDADVELPKTYFTCLSTVQVKVSTTAALIYPFHHCDDQERAESEDVLLATQLYELSLRYYVAGMQYAHSPYAFHTIGSTMAINASHYAKVRGFPKREAGEDFYLLNKLAKVGDVLELDKGPECEPIEIQARRSDRVPFGTGAAVNKIIALSDPVSEFRFYDPAVFELLQIWLKTLPAIWQSRSIVITDRLIRNQSDHDQRTGLQTLVISLKSIGTEKAIEHAFKQSKDLAQFTRQMHTWFDAFRTLKLIHSLRDQHLPSISYADLAANQTFAYLLTQDEDLAAFYEGTRLGFQ